jgi:tetratricopeptide (TPR) repeat protein
LAAIQQDGINYRIYLGEDDEEVDRLRCQLADTKRTLGDYNGAAELWSRALEGLDRSLGPRSKETIRARVDLASVLYSTGRLREARKVLGEARDLASRSLDHRDEVRVAVERLVGMVRAADERLGEETPITRRLARVFLRFRYRKHR